MANKTSGTTTAFLVLALCVIATPFAKEMLFDFSIDFIKWLRETVNPGFGKLLERAGEFLVTKEAYQLTLLLVSVINKSDWNFITSIAAGFSCSTAATLKIFF